MYNIFHIFCIHVVFIEAVFISVPKIHAVTKQTKSAGLCVSVSFQIPMGIFLLSTMSLVCVRKHINGGKLEAVAL